MSGTFVLIKSDLNVIDMRRLLITCLIAFIAGSLAAQPTPRASIKNTVKTTLVPSTSGQRGNSKANSRDQGVSTRPPAQDRSGASSALAPSLDNTGNTGARTGTTRPALAPVTNGSTTAKTVPSATKQANALEEVNPVRVKWMSLEEALEKSKTDKRKIFVDVFTDGCGWCKRMDSTTFMSPAVIEYLNEHYYPVKFNAEEQKEITYKDKTYQFKKNGARGCHELAAEWLNNRLTYPTVVFLDENQGVIQPLPGYQDAGKMEAILNYFGTDSHKKTPWESYQKSFNHQQKD